MVDQMKCNVIFSNPRGTTIFLRVYKYSVFCSFFSHKSYLEQAKNFKINTFHLECTNILGSGEPLGRIYENPNQFLRSQSIHLGRSIHKRFKYMKNFRNISLNPNIYNLSLTVSMHNSST